MSDTANVKNRTGVTAAVALAVLLALGLAMRVWGAWIYEYAHTSDHGIICLMVKHMLEGKELPVFFYGLPYMGAIEPAVSAALCAAFGLTGFWINMGTALVAFAFLPLVYLWGRGAAGRTAGLAALAFCVIGPPHYFQFESWADGGYAAIPFFSVLVLLLTVRLLTREAAGKRAGHGAFLALGLAAGLGWWQSPLLLAAFAVSAILFLAVLRARVFTVRLVSGAGGFLLGSLPLWLWNLRNQWQTFDMVRTHDRPPLLEGLRLFYGTRLPDLLEFFRYPAGVRMALGALLIALAALALARLVETRRARGPTLHLGAAVLFLLVFSVLFAQSRFARVNALRYVLIVIPALAVMLGAATAWLAARVRGGLGWLPVAALVALQAVELPKRPPERARALLQADQAARLGRFLEEREIRHLYTDYQVRGANHGLNFLLGEAFVFSPQTRERYRPYARTLELTAEPAVLNNSRDVASFLAAIGAGAQTGAVDAITVHYAIRPPAELGPLVPAAEWRAVIGPGAAEARAALTDADAGTGWTFPESGAARTPLEIRLARERPLAGVRLIVEGAGPAAFGVEGWRESAQAWIPLLPETPATRYFWSGSRFYWGGFMFRLEGRFPPFRTDRIRLILKRPGPGKGGLIQEAQLFEAGSGVPESVDPAALETLAEQVAARGIRRLYADRGDANALFLATRGRVRLPVMRHLFGRETLGAAVTLDEETGLLVRSREAEPTRRALAARDVAAAEQAVGPWILFAGLGAREGASAPRSPGLRWIGTGCVQAPAWRLAAGDAAAPAVPAPARFRGGIALEGVEMEPRLVPGEPARLRLFWRVKASADTDGLAVFVHFKRGADTLFQDDHLFLAGLRGMEEAGRCDRWVQERRIVVPETLATGELDLELGLYRVVAGKARRLPVRTSFPAPKNGVRVPAGLRVAAE